jgi:hypothetical protein
MDSAIKLQQQINRRQQLQIEAAQAQSADSHENSAKVTIKFPNEERKTFDFDESNKSQAIDIGSKWSRCLLGWGSSSSGHKYAQVTCSPMKNGIGLQDKLRMYGARAGCSPRVDGLLILDEGDPSASGAPEEYAIIVECH